MVVSDSSTVGGPADRGLGCDRERMIAEAAYFRAERRRFQGGDPVDDWLSAEAEIDQRLRGGLGHAMPGGDRGAFEERLATELRQFEATLHSFRQAARKARGTARSEKEKLLATLGELEERAHQRLGEIHQSGEAAWHDLRTGADKAWHELRRAIEAARSRFG
jgi:Protein of unknown function (DUF2934)